MWVGVGRLLGVVWGIFCVCVELFVSVVVLFFGFRFFFCLLVSIGRDFTKFTVFILRVLRNVEI